MPGFYILRIIGRQGGKVHLFRLFKYTCTFVEHILQQEDEYESSSIGKNKK